MLVRRDPFEIGTPASLHNHPQICHWYIVTQNHTGPARQDPYEICIILSLKYNLYTSPARLDRAEIGTSPLL